MEPILWVITILLLVTILICIGNINQKKRRLDELNSAIKILRGEKKNAEQQMQMLKIEKDKFFEKVLKSKNQN